MADFTRETSSDDTRWEGCYGSKVKCSGLESFLEDAFMMNALAEESESERFATCIWGHSGTGKCVSGDTLIVTQDGICEISSLFEEMPEDSSVRAKGVKIHTPHRTSPMKEVESLYYAGEKPSIGFRTSNGRELIGSLIHPVKVLTENGFVWKKMPDLQVGDMVVVDLIRHNRKDTRLPKASRSHYNQRMDFTTPDFMNEDLAFVLGALVGDGSQKKKYVSFSQEENKPLAFDYCCKFERIFGLKPHEKKDKRRDFLFSYEVYRMALRNWFKEIGLDYVGSDDVEVPWSVLYSSAKSQLAFVRGFIEAEGNDEKEGISMSSNSKRLLVKIQLILSQFDVISSLRRKTEKSWRLSVSGESARKLNSLINFSRAKGPWLEALRGNPNKDGVNALWTYEFLRKMKESHLKNGGTLTKKQIHSYPLNNIYGKCVAIENKAKKVSIWSRDKISKIADMLCEADGSFRTELTYVMSFRYEKIEKIWDNGIIPLYDVCVPDGHEFLTNGIVSHNTAIAKQFCKKRVTWREKEYNGYKVYDVPIAQFEEMGDLHGMPSRHVCVCKDGDCRWTPEEVLQGYLENGWKIDETQGVKTMYAPPDWVPTEEGPSILLLDDWNRASVRIIKGIMQLLQNYGMVSWKLPAGCNIVLTANPDEQDYLVTSLDSAILTRIRSVTLKTDAREWAMWAEGAGIDPRGINWVLANEEMMIGTERTNPRTLAEYFRFTNTVGNNFLAKKNSDGQTMITEDVKRARVMGHALLDTDTVTSIITFFERDVNLIINPEEILQGSDRVASHVHDMMSQKERRIDVVSIMVSRLFARIINRDHGPTASEIKNFQAFIKHPDMPEEQAFFIVNRCGEAWHNNKGVEMERWILGDKELQGFMSEML